MCYYFSKSKSVVSAREALSAEAVASEEKNKPMKGQESEEDLLNQEADITSVPERKCA